ncbi:PREDICTED: uncharacterized protein LOC104805436 [Tarenaya hassleriana]|uniref:uncharacterized protein LOC104805436 n=1 Tax=Tarenaya hassleriana TaxID=28532 RepID=UPI00053C145A|nr:PREDICTED: uncharacterized protein LOC104805436 [Tarenaya hassleriana]XP_019057139.1 PREDICTED: uncharacterized protein LOC104805436 [Tarenaya hassleriana]
MGISMTMCSLITLAENYPLQGIKELKGSFFNTDGPADSMSWFSEHGVPLKTEEDGRVFPVSDNSSSIVDCLLSEARVRGVRLESPLETTESSFSKLRIAERMLLNTLKRPIFLLLLEVASRGNLSVRPRIHMILELVESLLL